MSNNAYASRPRGTLNESRWEEVLTAATAVFAEKGYRSATLRDIAERVGLLTGSLYYYINSKEELLFEILKRSHLQGLEFVSNDQAVGGSLTPPERLARLIRNWMGGLQTLPPALRVAEFDFRSLPPDKYAEIEALRRKISDVPYRIISDGISQGYFDSSIDPHIATATLFRILTSTSEWYRPGGHVEWSKVSEFYVRLVVEGMAIKT